MAFTDASMTDLCSWAELHLQSCIIRDCAVALPPFLPLPELARHVQVRHQQDCAGGPHEGSGGGVGARRHPGDLRGARQAAPLLRALHCLLQPLPAP